MSKDPTRSPGDTASAEEIVELRGRALLILSAIEREEPGAQWASLRSVVENAAGVTDLRTVHREVRTLLAALSLSARERLERDLAQRFGPDVHLERDKQVVAEVRSTGRVRTEREYRIVQAYLDALPPSASDRDVLGPLLRRIYGRALVPWVDTSHDFRKCRVRPNPPLQPTKPPNIM